MDRNLSASALHLLLEVCDEDQTHNQIPKEEKSFNGAGVHRLDPPMTWQQLRAHPDFHECEAVRSVGLDEHGAVLDTISDVPGMKKESTSGEARESDLWLEAKTCDSHELWQLLLHGQYGCYWLHLPDKCLRCRLHPPQSQFPAEVPHFDAEAQRLAVGFLPVVECHAGCPVECHEGCPVECHEGCPVECHAGCPVECHAGCPGLCFQGQSWLLAGKKHRHKPLSIRSVCTLWQHADDWSTVQDSLHDSFQLVRHLWIQNQAFLVGFPNTLVQSWHDVEPLSDQQLAVLRTNDTVWDKPPVLLVKCVDDQIRIKSTVNSTFFESHGKQVHSDDLSHVLDAQSVEFAVSGKVDSRRLFTDLLSAHLRRYQRLHNPQSPCVEHFGNGSIAESSCARARQLILNALVPGFSRSGGAFTDKSRSGVLAAIRELARHRQNQHGYLSAALICGRSDWHIDPQNVYMSSTVALGTYTGGLLEVAKEAEFKAELIDTKLRWYTFESDKSPHRVTPFEDDRVAIVLYTPGGVLRLTRDCWRRLFFADFPVLSWLEHEGRRLESESKDLCDWHVAATHCQVLTQGVLGADLCLPFVSDLPPVPEDTELTEDVQATEDVATHMSSSCKRPCKLGIWQSDYHPTSQFKSRLQSSDKRCIGHM
eukprot:3394247-Amphidinium_carterae.2